MKTITLALDCDIAGCKEATSATAASKGTAAARLLDRGWRMGATRDVCPSCRDKGHRP